MADEEHTEAEETTDAPDEAAPEAPAEEVTDAPEAEAAEEPQEAADEPAEKASAPAPAAEASEPEEVLHPKQIRSRKRSTHTGEALPQRDAEARAAERSANRQKAAADRRRYRAKHSGGESGEGTPAADREPGAKKVRLGKVVSDKGDKTITVKVEVVHRHRRYEKVIRRSDTLHAHDERNEAGEGDTVRVIESRPLSRTKRWRLVEVVEKAR
jgi:small subunit ribosomal protein S17